MLIIPPRQPGQFWFGLTRCEDLLITACDNQLWTWRLIVRNALGVMFARLVNKPRWNVKVMTKQTKFSLIFVEAVDVATDNNIAARQINSMDRPFPFNFFILSIGASIIRKSSVRQATKVQSSVHKWNSTLARVASKEHTRGAARIYGEYANRRSRGRRRR